MAAALKKRYNFRSESEKGGGTLFYKDLFATLCFIFFGIALATHHPYFYFGAMLCGCLSMTAKRKIWANPAWSDAFYDKIEDWIKSKTEGPKTEFSEDEEIKPLPPLDDNKK